MFPYKKNVMAYFWSYSMICNYVIHMYKIGLIPISYTCIWHIFHDANSTMCFHVIYMHEIGLFPISMHA